jgi:Mrp family chromosome partitioning ATPase
VKSIIQASATDSNVDILPAGEFRAAAPGNLIAHDHLKTILSILRDVYDYVILDTSAVGSHGDALVDGLADVSCIVCRSCQVKKSEVEYMNQLGETKRLPDPMFIYNGVRAE